MGDQCQKCWSLFFFANFGMFILLQVCTPVSALLWMLAVCPLVVRHFRYYADADGFLVFTGVTMIAVVFFIPIAMVILITLEVCTVAPINVYDTRGYYGGFYSNLYRKHSKSHKDISFMRWTVSWNISAIAQVHAQKLSRAVHSHLIPKEEF